MQGSPDVCACVETDAKGGSAACRAYCSCAPDEAQRTAVSSAAALGVAAVLGSDPIMSTVACAGVRQACSSAGLISIGSVPTVPLDTKLMGWLKRWA